MYVYKVLIIFIIGLRNQQAHTLYILYKRLYKYQFNIVEAIGYEVQTQRDGDFRNIVYNYLLSPNRYNFINEI